MDMFLGFFFVYDCSVSLHLIGYSIIEYERVSLFLEIEGINTFCKKNK